MKTYDVVAAAIEAQETGHCFALLGDGNMHFAGALAHLGMPFTYARHEHCAVSMAMAYARVTGRPGLATVTCGPGLTQVMTGLAAAVRARIPLVLFVGESPLRNSWYNQEIDQAPLCYRLRCGICSYLAQTANHAADPRCFCAVANDRHSGCDWHAI